MLEDNTNNTNYNRPFISTLIKRKVMNHIKIMWFIWFKFNSSFSSNDWKVAEL